MQYLVKFGFVRDLLYMTYFSNNYKKHYCLIPRLNVLSGVCAHARLAGRRLVAHAGCAQKASQ